MVEKIKLEKQLAKNDIGNKMNFIENDESGDTGNPNDYYFSIFSFDDEPTEEFVLITPKIYWNKYLCLIDDCLAIDDLLDKNDVWQTSDSCYEYTPPQRDIRKFLKNLGLEENNDLQDCIP